MEITTFCEYLHEPIGIDSRHPRFSWRCEDTGGALYQKSYRIIVGTEEGFAQQEYIWDSGTVSSRDSLNITYAGEPLETAQKYTYQVTVITDEDQSFCSKPAHFMTGIVEEKDWYGGWIGGALMEEHTFWFRNVMMIEKEIKEATAFVASPNYYVFTVNQKAVTDSVLNNAWTDCEKTILYAAYPITPLLNKGKNVLGMELGNGWNALELGASGGGLGEHLFSLQILIRYADGSQSWLAGDHQDWRYTVEGPILLNSIYQGEDYDARRELGDWDGPGYEPENTDVCWRDAVEFEPPHGKARAQVLEPIKVVERIKPVQIYDLGDGSYTVDMGQNFAGWAHLKVRADRGTKIIMEFSELENEDHTLNRISIRGVRATDSYICKGDGIEEYEPRFTYHGFRYVRVYGLPEYPQEDTVIGCVVRSAVEQIGSFHSSNRLLNQLQSNIVWSEASNLHGLPTDCPQRDERLGWLNDMTVRNECALYNYRLPQLYTKWLGDIRDTQGEVSGAITDTAPFRKFGQRPADPVSSSFLLIPWNLYCHYHDKQIIAEHYPAMKRWAAYLKRNSKNYIMSYSPMGDWAAPIEGTNANSIGGGAVSTITPTQLMATGYFYYDCQLLAKMAEVLEIKEDVIFYQEEAARIKEAFNREYYHPKEKYYASGSQASNTFPLYLGLVDEADRQAVLDHLLNDIVNVHQMHLSTGNLCSRYIIEVLLQEGYEDIAFKLLTQNTYPSWGYMIEKGATTIWERWEEVTDDSSGLSAMASYNHPMNGAVGVCFYKYLTGIRVDEARPGFQNICFRPIMPQGLEQAQASVETMKGTVESSWQRSGDGQIDWQIRVPFNCTGEVHLPQPDGTYQVIHVAAGSHHFQVDK